MNKIIRLAIIVVAVLIGVTFIKNGVFGAVISGALSKAAHVPVKIGSTDVSFTKAAITLKNVKIHNPSSFRDRTLLDAPLVAIDFDPPALMKGQIHFQEARLNLKEIVVVKNKKGELNVDAMKPRKDETQKAKQTGKTGKAPALLIDKLYLSVGRVVYKDYSMGGEPMVQSFDIGIKDKLYQNIDNPTELVSLIMKEALIRTTIGSLANLDIGSFKDGASGVLGDGLSVLGDSSVEVQTKVKDILGLFK